MDREREQKKEERRRRNTPKARHYTVKLADGSTVPVYAHWDNLNNVTITAEIDGKKISCNFEFGISRVDRRVRMYGKIVRDESGKPVLVKVPLPSTVARLTFHRDGLNYKAVSVCKPPDRPIRSVGMNMALRHLLKQKSVHARLKDGDYESLRKVFLTKPPKPSQIARAERLMKKKDRKRAAKKRVKV